MDLLLYGRPVHDDVAHFLGKCYYTPLWMPFAAMQQPAQAAAPAPAQVTPLPKPSGPVPAQGTHKAVFRFIPRHGDELDMKPGDPIAVQSQAPDLWFSGFNLRTGQSGIFPGHCVGDVKSRGPTQPGPKMKPARFRVRWVICK